MKRVAPILLWVQFILSLIMPFCNYEQQAKLDEITTFLYFVMLMFILKQGTDKFTRYEHITAGLMLWLALGKLWDGFNGDPYKWGGAEYIWLIIGFSNSFYYWYKAYKNGKNGRTRI